MKFTVEVTEFTPNPDGISWIVSFSVLHENGAIQYIPMTVYANEIKSQYKTRGKILAHALTNMLPAQIEQMCNTEYSEEEKLEEEVNARVEAHRLKIYEETKAKRTEQAIATEDTALARQKEDRIKRLKMELASYDADTNTDSKSDGKPEKVTQ